MLELLSEAPDVHRAAILHGFGMGLPTARPDVPEEWDALVTKLALFIKLIDLPFVNDIAEGMGFARGFTIDAYMPSQLDSLSDAMRFPRAFQVPYYRGLGWGYRQRYLEPPDHVPEGLAIVEHIPADMRRAFFSGYLAQILPLEAAVMASAETEDAATVVR